MLSKMCRARLPGNRLPTESLSLKLLVVEDHALVREGMVLTLRRLDRSQQCRRCARRDRASR
jgi:hypothetical protein